jgi:superfamily I DNA/RNA helicase
LDIIKKDFSCTVFPMTQTYRCGKAIVTLAQSLVSDYRAAPSNHEGEVLHMSEADFNKIDFVAGQDAVICRNTRPLIAVAYNMIKRGIPAHIEGKEIGKGLLALTNRWQSVKTIPTLVSRLTEWQVKECAKLLLAKQELQADALADKVESLKAIIDGLPKNAALADLRTRIETMFADTESGQKAATVVLMTAHRSKGREYSRVFGYGVSTLMPSKRATQAHEIEQEYNLMYVLWTRAINTYVDVSLDS